MPPTPKVGLSEKLEALQHGAVEQIQVTVSSNLPGREQTVRLTRDRFDDYVATTNVTTGADEQVRADIFSWNERHPLVMFRISDGSVTARIDLAGEVDVQTHITKIRYLARLADRLEYEVARGRDSH